MPVRRPRGAWLAMACNGVRAGGYVYVYVGGFCSFGVFGVCVAALVLCAEWTVWSEEVGQLGKKAQFGKAKRAHGNTLSQKNRN